METIIDIVTVFHNEENRRMAFNLLSTLEELENPDIFKFIMVDNTVDNRGFAKGCNYGAAQGKSKIIGFINPDVLVERSFIDRILPAFQPISKDDSPVIVGVTFGKPPWEWELWGCEVWVCGAFMFVRRDWFESIGGFDEQFVWSWEETDLIRTAQAQKRRVVAIDRSPGWFDVVNHESPDNDNKIDSEYKRFHFENGARLFRKKWGK